MLTGSGDRFRQATGAPTALTTVANGSTRDDRPIRRWAVVTGIFVLATVVMLRPNPFQLASKIPANTADPALITWILAWGNHALVTDPRSFFDANIFWPHPSTLAYSDTLLPLVPVFGVLHFVTNSWSLSINIISLLLVPLNLFATYALARRITGRSDAAVLGALAFGFGTYVFAHWGHVQLQTLGLLPLAFLLMFRLLEKPGVGRAILLGVVSASVALAAAYDGAGLAVAGLVVVVGHLVLQRRRPEPWLLVCLGIAALVAAVIIAPVAVEYLRLQHQPGFRRALDSTFALHLGNFAAPAPGNYLWQTSSTRTHIETSVFPGLTVGLLAVAGATALAWGEGQNRRSSPEAVVRSRRELTLLILGGLAALLLAFGPQLGPLPGPFRFFHDHVPGYAGIRATARLAIIFLLAVAILASYGYSWLAGRLRSRRVVLLLPVVVGLLMLAEFAAPVPWARLPVDAATLAPYRELAHRPAGAVVELPIPAGVEDDYVEGPRMIYSSLDWHPRFNGYSGFFPANYFSDAQVMDTFPAPSSLDRARVLRIRYVILHMGTEDGFPMLSEAEARAMISSLPQGAVATRTGNSWLVDLGPV
jgi:hypothetical protein